MRLRAAALAVLFVVAGCATPQSRPADFRAAWACASRTNTNGLDVTLVRTLDAQGQQIDAEIQWSMGGFDGGRLSLMGSQQIKGAGDPPVRPRELLISWSGFSDRVQRARMLMVLHPADEPPNALDGVAMIPYVNGLIGGMFSWQRVQALAQNGSSARLSLIDQAGHPVRSARLDFSRFNQLPERSRDATEESRAKAIAFEKKCEPVSEWMKL